MTKHEDAALSTALQLLASANSQVVHLNAALTLANEALAEMKNAQEAGKAGKKDVVK